MPIPLADGMDYVVRLVLMGMGVGIGMVALLKIGIVCQVIDAPEFLLKSLNDQKWFYEKCRSS